MRFVVGLCGTHGTGKSTIIQGIKRDGGAVSEVQLSRNAQKALGWESLSWAQESATNMWALQNAILDAMDARDAAIVASKQITLVERTPLDALAYTKMWCARLDLDPNANLLFYQYEQRCMQMSERYAKFIYIPMREEVPFVEEAHRADFASREFIAGTISDTLIENRLPEHQLHSTEREARITEVADVLGWEILKRGVIYGNQETNNA